MQNVSSSNSQAVNVPKLRFPGFEEEWTKSNIGDIGSFFKGAPLSKADISNNGTPFILYGELYTTYGEVATDIKRKTEATVSDAYISKMGDVIIPTSGETPEDIATATCVMTPGVILAGDLCIMRNPKIDGRFLSYSINHKAKYKIARIAQGKSIVHIRSDEVEKISINYPTSAEQEKILKFLNLLAQKIEKQQALVDALKLYKRGVLNKLFSSSCDMQKNALGDLCNITTGKLDANAMENDGIYRFYTCAKEFYWINTYAFDTDALLISGNGANVGYIHHFCGKFNAYQRTYVLDKFNTVNIIYVKYYLEAKLKERIESEKKAGNTPYIVLSTLSEMPVYMPNAEVQQKISSLLTNIDKMIENEDEILCSLSYLKQGLLQQMFI